MSTRLYPGLPPTPVCLGLSILWHAELGRNQVQHGSGNINISIGLWRPSYKWMPHWLPLHNLFATHPPFSFLSQRKQVRTLPWWNIFVYIVSQVSPLTPVVWGRKMCPSSWVRAPPRWHPAWNTFVCKHSSETVNSQVNFKVTNKGELKAGLHRSGCWTCNLSGKDLCYID